MPKAGSDSRYLGRMTSAQRDRLVEYMAERHNFFLRRHNDEQLPKSTPVSCLRREEWHKLAEELNRLGEPRDGAAWSYSWRNLKHKLKIRYSKREPTCETDQKVMAIINSQKGWIRNKGSVEDSGANDTDEEYLHDETMEHEQKPSATLEPIVVSVERKPPTKVQTRKDVLAAKKLVSGEFMKSEQCVINSPKIEEEPGLTIELAMEDALLADYKTEPDLDPLSSNYVAPEMSPSAPAEQYTGPSTRSGNTSNTKPPPVNNHLGAMQSHILQSLERTSFDRERNELLREQNALLRNMQARSDAFRKEVSAHYRGIEAHNRSVEVHNREMRELKREKLAFLMGNRPNGNYDQQ